MTTLAVYYQHSGAWQHAPGRFVINNYDQLPELELLLKSDHLREVVIYGPGMATGWRLTTPRPVHFVEAGTRGDADANAQRNASLRIVHRTENKPSVLIPATTKEHPMKQFAAIVPASFVSLYANTGRKPDLVPVNQEAGELTFATGKDKTALVTLRANGTWTVSLQAPEL